MLFFRRQNKFIYDYMIVIWLIDLSVSSFKFQEYNRVHVSSFRRRQDSRYMYMYTHDPHKVTSKINNLAILCQRVSQNHKYINPKANPYDSVKVKVKLIFLFLLLLFTEKALLMALKLYCFCNPSNNEPYLSWSAL